MPVRYLDCVEKPPGWIRYVSGRGSDTERYIRRRFHMRLYPRHGRKTEIEAKAGAWHRHTAQPMRTSESREWNMSIMY